MASTSRFVIDDQHMDTVTLLSDPDDEEDGEDELFNRDDGLTFDPRLSELEQMHIDDGLYSITPPSVTYRIAMTPYVWIASAMAALGGVLFGYDLGIVSGALLQLKMTFNLSCFQQEMVVSSMLLGALFGSVIGGFIVDWIGRRQAIIANAFIFVIGAIILATAHSYVVLIIGRLVVGFAVSISAIGECIYISEISPVKRRGQLVSLNELGITMGLLLAYLVNYTFISVPQGWRYMFGLGSVPAALQCVGMVFMPPSPRFLVQKGRDSQAHAVLQTLRGTCHVDGELNNIRASLLNEQVYSVFDLLRSADNMRGRMMIGVALVFFQQFTGQTNVLYYAPSVFQALGLHTNTSATLATVGLGIVKVLATTVCLLFVDKVGRRSLLLFGAVCMMLVMAILGILTMTIHPVNTTWCSEFHLHMPVINVTDAPVLLKGQSQEQLLQAFQEIYTGSKMGNSEDIVNRKFRKSISEEPLDGKQLALIKTDPAIIHDSDNVAVFLSTVFPWNQQKIVELNLQKLLNSTHNYDQSNLLSLLHSNFFAQYISDQIILTKDQDQRENNLKHIFLKLLKTKLYHNDVDKHGLFKFKRSVAEQGLPKKGKRKVESGSATSSPNTKIINFATVDSSLQGNLKTDGVVEHVKTAIRATDDESIEAPTTVQYKNIASTSAKSVRDSTGSINLVANDHRVNGLTVSETTIHRLQTESKSTMLVSPHTTTGAPEGGNIDAVITTTSPITIVTTASMRHDHKTSKVRYSSSGAAQVIAVIALMCYIAAYAIGFGPVTWLILTEIFPAGIRGRATSFASIFNWTTNLLVSATFLDIINSIGTSWTFFAYSVICGVSVLVVFLIVPETKNKSLEQISADLKKGSTIGRACARCRHQTSCTLLCCCQLSISHSRLPLSDLHNDFGSANQVSVSNTRL